MIKVFTPATSANLGPGFDCLGISYDLYNEFDVELSKDLIIEGCDKKYQNKDNLFYKGFSSVAKKVNRKEKCHVIFKTNIPVSRGLGSSASLIVAGVISANELFDKKLSKEECFEIATKIEGHPDNIAPCLYGGCTCAYMDKKPYVSNLKVYKDLSFTLIIPNFELSTSLSRSVLPKDYTREDVVYNISRSVLLVNALESGNETELKQALTDKIHQPYRKKLIKNYAKVEKLCLDKGAIQTVLSGAGPTMLAISKEKDFSKKIKDKLPKGYLVYDLKVSKKGVIVK